MTFAEFVQLQGQENEAFAEIRDRLGLATLVERYLRIGGFPEHALHEDAAIDPEEVRAKLRADVVDRVIARDLAEFGVDLPRLRSLLVYLIRDSGAILSIAERARDLGAKRPTVSNYLELLEDTLLVSRLDRFHRRATAALRTHRKPKIYAADHGLIGAFSLLPPNDADVRGRVFEAVVFRHLRELRRTEDTELNYVRINNLEVDFLIRREGLSVLLEVTSSTRVREDRVRKVSRAASAVGATRGYIVHGGPEAPVATGNAIHAGQVQPISLAEFLQNPSSILEQAGRE